MVRLSTVPLGAVILGVAGLVPFLGFAALAVSGKDAGLETIGLSPRTMLSAYGAVIASFLGGIRWGVAAARGAGSADYLLTILPSLVAWAALAVPGPWDLRILGGLVLLWGFVDQDLSRRGLIPTAEDADASGRRAIPDVRWEAGGFANIRDRNQEASSMPLGITPAWLSRLRLGLSIVAGLLLLIAA